MSHRFKLFSLSTEHGIDQNLEWGIHCSVLIYSSKKHCIFFLSCQFDLTCFDFSKASSFACFCDRNLLTIHYSKYWSSSALHLIALSINFNALSRLFVTKTASVFVDRSGLFRLAILPKALLFVCDIATQILYQISFFTFKSKQQYIITAFIWIVFMYLTFGWSRNKKMT